MRVLVLRNDRLGDLVLSTPAISTIKENHPDSYLGLLVSRYAMELVVDNPDIDLVISDEDIEKQWSFRKFLKILQKIKNAQFDTALILHPTFKVCLLVFLAGIRRRISHGSKWYVYLFCNEILLQRRSRVLKHEADYNIELATLVGGIKRIRKDLKIAVRKESLTKIRKILEDKEVGEDFVIIHPGSGGSARNWSVQNYACLADFIIEKGGVKCLFTGTDRDIKTINEIELRMKKKGIKIINLDRLADLVALISLSRLFVSSSTGPLHIATALKKHVVGFYSPVLVQSSLRWGPYNSNHAIVFTPEVRCPSRFHCLYEKCPYYDCMELIKPEEVIEKITTAGFLKKTVLYG